MDKTSQGKEINDKQLESCWTFHYLNTKIRISRVIPNKSKNEPGYWLKDAMTCVIYTSKQRIGFCTVSWYERNTKIATTSDRGQKFIAGFLQQRGLASVNLYRYFGIKKALRKIVTQKERNRRVFFLLGHSDLASSSSLDLKIFLRLQDHAAQI